MAPCLQQIDQVCLSLGKSFLLEFTLMSISFGVTLILTRLAVDQFTSSGLDALGQKLGRLDMARAADISRQACAGENSFTYFQPQPPDSFFRPQFSGARPPLPGAAQTTQP